MTALSVAEWLPARVPGDVRANLIAVGRIPPVETPAGIAAGVWVDDCDWWYRAELTADLAPDEVAILEADGIDYTSTIWLDGRLLATHAGMFARQTVVLSPWLNAPGLAARELAIRIWGGGALPRLPNPPWRRAMRWLVDKLSPGTEYFPDRMATPKAQFSFGWDFAPRLFSTGIWDEIRLVITRGAYIEDLWVRAEPLAGGGGGRGGGAEGWRSRGTRTQRRLHRPDLRCACASGGGIPVRIGLRWPSNLWDSPHPRRRRFGNLGLDWWNWRRQSAHDAVAPEPSELSSTCDQPGEQKPLDLNLSLDLPAARLWWPWDQGEPCLYRVTVRLLDEKGVLDEASQVVGVRTVERAAFPDGGKWRWLVNGRHVFLRGANWAPVDVLPGRVTEAEYTRLLGMARAAGINFLRVWGGGVREKRAFWETCDRLGIMAWQEFPLACAFLDHYPRDPAYLGALASRRAASSRRCATTPA